MTDFSANPHAMPLSRALDDVPLGVTEQEIEPGIVARTVRFGPAPEPQSEPPTPVLWEDIAREAAEEIVEWIGTAPLSRHELAQAQHWARILNRALALIDGRRR